MTGNTLFDSQRMFKHACAFFDCAKFCETEPQNINMGVCTHLVADIVNSAFACEVFIKSLLIFNKLTLEDIRGHKLKDLWTKYKEIDNERALLIEKTVNEFFGNDEEFVFGESLENVSDAFVNWRYIYEKHSGSIHLQFLRIFREILREHCCKEIYKMTWKEFEGRE